MIVRLYKRDGCRRMVKKLNLCILTVYSGATIMYDTKCLVELVYRNQSGHHESDWTVSSVVITCHHLLKMAH